MSIVSRSVRPLFGGCALGLASLAFLGCSDASSEANLLPMSDPASSAPGAAGAPSSIGSKRHGRAAKAPPKQHVQTSDDSDLSVKELRAKKRKAQGLTEGFQP